MAERQADPRAVEIEKRLPGPEWKERSGAAGTTADQRRNSPIVELSLLLVSSSD